MSAAHLTNGDGPSGALSFQESNRFEVCESIVEKGLQTFIEVGAALLEIRDNRYYRQEFGTFEDYCRQRWQIERRHAYRLIDAAQVVQNLCPTGHIPDSERVTRPLTKLEPEQQREVWQSATRLSPKPTAELVAKIVEKAIADAAAKHEKSIHGGIAAILANLPQTEDQPQVKRTKNFDDWLKLIGAIDDLNEIEDFDPVLIASEEFKEFVKERLATGPRAIEIITQYLAELKKRFPNVLS